MRRTLGIVAVTTAALLLIELLMQTPLYRWVQPTILSPTDGAVVAPPLAVQWDGPPRMELVLLAGSGPPQVLGLHSSPWELGTADLSKPGIYRLRVRAPLLGDFIQSERRFVVPEPAPAPPPPVADPRVKQLDSSVAELKAANDHQQGENDSLRQENTSLREENASLQAQVDANAKAQEEDAGRAADEADRLAQLRQQNQALTEQLNVLQWQLNAALICRVWGYYSFPRPQTYPPTRRAITVTNALGVIFQTEAECEALRISDPTTASRCFCVGAP